jgi:quinol monooxygenase YgiN
MMKVIAKMEIKEGMVEAVKEGAVGFAVEARKEEGCLSYQLFVDVSNKNVLIMVEEWESPEALQKHTSSELFQNTMKQLAEVQEKDMEVNVCTLVV